MDKNIQFEKFEFFFQNYQKKLEILSRDLEIFMKCYWVLMYINRFKIKLIYNIFPSFFWMENLLC